MMDQAARDRDMYDRQTVLFLDEIHRFTKAQQDALLPGVETRQVILVAATTENPSFSIIAPLLSRSMLITLEPLSDEEVRDVLAAAVVRRARAGRGVRARRRRHRAPRADRRRRRPAGPHLHWRPPREWRRTAYRLAPTHDGPVEITLAHTEQAVAFASVRYDRTGDQHYDVASALIKSMRGSDVDAALHYLARMLEAGEDPRFIARRIVIAASEDVGHGRPDRAADRRGGHARRRPDRHARGADHPGPGGRAQRARAQEQRGLHRHQRGDRRHPRGQAAARCPRTCAAAGMPGRPGSGTATATSTPTTRPDGVAQQDYLPDDLQGKTDYYRPTDRGFEERLGPRWEWLKARIRRS